MTISVLQIVECALPDANPRAESLTAAEGALAALGVHSRLLGGNPTESDLKNTDVVHIHGWGYESAENAINMACAHRVPYIFSPHGGGMIENPVHSTGFFQRIRRRLRNKKFTRRAVAMTGINQIEVQGIRDERLHERIELLPYGWPIPADIHRQSTNERDLVVLDPFSPLLSGSTMLLKLLADLGAAADGWKITFAGGCADNSVQMLEAAVARKGMSDRVSFITRSNRQTRTEWSERATTLVSAWMNVIFPSSIMQAMAYGVPALCTDQVAMDGMGDAIRICRPDRASLREGLRALLSMSDAERMATSIRAREYAKKNLDWSVVAPRFADLYRSVI
ncbi:MAG: glycosyltransferase [Planctomycetes bacterium]|nr:glycosyltransferase [Planctomycetota bacterium]MBI3835556.1 glycosyltransferase [Planctomycetota bacterium]